jgi:hypothetical protein
MDAKKPHAAGWLIAATLCSFMPVAPSVFVYSQWQDINEFTFMVTMIPAVIALLLWGVAFTLWGIWAFQFMRVQKFKKEASASHQREQARYSE